MEGGWGLGEGGGGERRGGGGGGGAACLDLFVVKCQNLKNIKL
jgi:hypothetical protein